ncbi:MAG: AbrB family transcriptional regulator [Phascolarctobacterium sp.]|nr:AbrB family transcriptional regulator [Phascolarctobacterium sp.]
MLDRLLLFIVAGFLGTLMMKMHIPIPYMLGGMITAILYKTFARERAVSWPRLWRDFGLMVAGYGIGVNFNTQAWNNFLEELLGVTEATAIALGVSIVIAIVTSKITREDLQSCIVGMLPGGMTLSLLMAEEDKRVNPNVVMVMQVIRLFGVIISVPFLTVWLLDAKVIHSPLALVEHAGYHWSVFLPLTFLGGFVAKKLHLPTPTLLGAILATTIFNIFVGSVQPVPGLLMAPAQVSIGLYMGMIMDAKRIAQTKDILPFALGGTALLVVISIGVAYVLSDRYGFSLVTAFLAMAPGGIAEMALAGLSMGEDVATILAYQLVRLLAINMLVPPLLEIFFRKKQAIR